MLTMGLSHIGGFPGAQMVKNLPAVQEIQDWSWVGKTPWRREWQPTPVLLAGEFHGQRSLVGDSSWGNKELNTTEPLIYRVYYAELCALYTQFIEFILL